MMDASFMDKVIRVFELALLGNLFVGTEKYSQSIIIKLTSLRDFRSSLKHLVNIFSGEVLTGQPRDEDS